MAGIEVEGLAEFRYSLGKASNRSAIKAELKEAEKDIGRDVERLAQSYARGLGGAHKHFADRIFAQTRVSGVYIGSRRGIAVGAWGARQRTGWYAKSGSRGRRQHPAWVGNSGWEVGGSSGGPYGVNQAIHDRKPQILEAYEKAMQRLVDSVEGV